jgi:hypothetical protein
VKLLYSGGSQCDDPTFKRLLLVGTELSFMDRPSVVFGKMGTVGHDSIFRQYDFDKASVPVSVYAPPRRQTQEIYHPYATADFENPEFAKIILDGIRNDPAFSAKFIQEQGNYGNGITGRLVINALARAGDIAPLPFAQEIDPRKLYTIDSTEGLQSTLKAIMQDASVQVTSALLVADEAQAIPVSNDPYFLKLLALRTSSASYVGSASTHASLIGLEFARAVIPDDALQRLSIKEIMTYREKSAPLYAAWSAELNHIAAKIDDLSISEIQERIPKLITTELNPKIAVYKNEMAAVRDDLFAGIMKGMINWKAPTLSIASYTTLGYTTAVAAFASSLLASTAAPIIDFVKSRRNVNRKHAVSYLIGARGDA